MDEAVRRLGRKQEGGRGKLGEERAVNDKLFVDRIKKNIFQGGGSPPFMLGDRPVL